MPTLEEALLYLGIDYTDEMTNANVTRALATAARTLQGAVGEDIDTYLPDDPRVKELTLIYTDDLYSTRGVAAKVSGATRRLVADMELQLRLELARAKEGMGVESAPKSEIRLTDGVTGAVHSLKVEDGSLTLTEEEAKA